MIKENTNTINKIVGGTTQINRAYLNGSVVFGSVPMPLYVDTSAITFTAKSGSREIKVKGENWSAAVSGNFISISPVSGDGTSILTVSVLENTVIDTPRSGSITISSNGESVVVDITQEGARSHSFPDVDVIFNINAKEYESTTLSFPEGLYNQYNTDYFTSDSWGGYTSSTGLKFNITNGGTPTPSTDFITIPSGTHINLLFPSTGVNFFNISNIQEMTIIYKAKPTSGENIVGNRSDGTFDGQNNGGSYNYMIRQKSSYVTVHLRGEGYGNVSSTYGSDDIIAFTFRENNGSVTVQGYNYTTGQYGTENNGGYNAGSSRFGLFTGNYSGEEWGGDFYWMCICPGLLTEEEIADIVDFNEN